MANIREIVEQWKYGDRFNPCKDKDDLKKLEQYAKDIEGLDWIIEKLYDVAKNPYNGTYSFQNLKYLFRNHPEFSDDHIKIILRKFADKYKEYLKKLIDELEQRKFCIQLKSNDVDLHKILNTYESYKTEFYQIDNNPDWYSLRHELKSSYEKSFGFINDVTKEFDKEFKKLNDDILDDLISQIKGRVEDILSMINPQEKIIEVDNNFLNSIIGELISKDNYKTEENQLTITTKHIGTLRFIAEDKIDVILTYNKREYKSQVTRAEFIRGIADLIDMMNTSKNITYFGVKLEQSNKVLCNKIFRSFDSMIDKLEES